MTQLSTHFSLAEMTRSSAADRLGDANDPTPAHLANLKVTAAGLEQVRDLFGGLAVTVLSGYRNPRVNKAVGGVPNSDHAQGFAADITVTGVSAYQVALRLQAAVRSSRINVDQVIYEKSRGIVHVSFAPRMRGQVLTQAGGPGTACVQGVIK